MRILWITHDPIRTSIGRGHSSSGFWKESLLNHLKAETDNEIFVAFPGKKKRAVTKEAYNFRYPAKKRYTDLPAVTYNDLQWIIEECNPQLIHIHGTEIPYGLISKQVRIPVLISLQGFISECYNGLLADIALPEWKKEKTIKELVLRNSFPDMHSQWFFNAACEKRTVKANRFFFGRTGFDNHFLMKNNAATTYFTGNEILRDEFYEASWNISQIKRHSIYTSSFSNPIKGFHVLLQAISYLTKEFPDLEIVVPGKLTPKMLSRVWGNSYYRILRKMIEINNLQKHITFSGKLDGKQIAKILQQTHVFTLPSFMENSSNALGEAQLTGTPCIASNCGGSPFIVKENENGLIFARGDAYDLAMKIRMIFLDDQLAERLSQQGKIAGTDFHSKAKILSQYCTTYKKIVTFENSF